MFIKLKDDMDIEAIVNIGKAIAISKCNKEEYANYKNTIILDYGKYDIEFFYKNSENRDKEYEKILKEISMYKQYIKIVDCSEKDNFNGSANYEIVEIDENGIIYKVNKKDK